MSMGVLRLLVTEERCRGNDNNDDDRCALRYTIYMDTGMSVKIFELFPMELTLWLVLGVVFIIFGIFSSILLWHWKTYSTGKFTTVSNMLIYIGVAGGFILMMILSVLWFSLV